MVFTVSFLPLIGFRWKHQIDGPKKSALEPLDAESSWNELESDKKATKLFNAKVDEVRKALGGK